MGMEQGEEGDTRGAWQGGREETRVLLSAGHYKWCAASRMLVKHAAKKSIIPVLQCSTAAPLLLQNQFVSWSLASPA